MTVQDAAITPAQHICSGWRLNELEQLMNIELACLNTELARSPSTNAALICQQHPCMCCPCCSCPWHCFAQLYGQL